MSDEGEAILHGLVARQKHELNVLKARIHEIRIDAAHAGIRHAMENLIHHIGPMYVGEEAAKVVALLEQEDKS